MSPTDYITFHQLATAVNHNLAIALFDLNGTFEFVNKNFCVLSQYSEEELINKPFTFFLHELHDKEQLSQALLQVNQGQVWQGDVLNKRKDGTPVWVSSTIVPILDGEGNPYLFFTYKIDISHEKETEDKLRLIEQELVYTTNELGHFKYVLDQSSQVVIVDHNKKIIYSNEQFAQLTLYSITDIIGKEVKDLMSRCHPKSFYEAMWRTAYRGEVWSGDVRTKNKAGEYNWTSARIFPIFNSDNTISHFICVGHDITQAKEAEQMMFRSKTLSALGELAAGVAHEIRNPLTSLKGFTALLDQSETHPRRKTYLSMIASEIDRIEYTVNELMLLAKPQKFDMSMVKIEDLVCSICKFLQPELSLKNILLTCRSSDPSAEVSCDANQIKQVVMNVIKNSIEAIDDGGIIDISYSYAPSEMSILIKDNGKGMSEEVLKEIEIPFFTTKTTGNGLGIPVCQNIMREHDGEMNISSELGVGTVVTLTLKNE